MKHKDERAKLTNAILSDIKVIKLYGWEKTFMEKVHAIREQELQALKRSQILFSASLASFHSSTFLVSGSSSYTKHALLHPLLFVVLSGQILPVGQLKIISVWSSWWSHRRSSAPVISHTYFYCPNSSVNTLPCLMMCSKQMKSAL